MKAAHRDGLAVMVWCGLVALGCTGGGGGGGAAPGGGGGVFAGNGGQLQIAGAVSGAVSAGVTVTISGPVGTPCEASGSVVTDAAGNYAFAGLLGGGGLRASCDYTLTPSKAGYVFFPPSLSVSLTTFYAPGRNFSAMRSYPVSGTVSGAIEARVLVTATGPVTVEATTSSAGAFDLSLPDGTYRLSVSKPGYTFTPWSTSVTVAGAGVGGQHFAASSSPSTCLAGGWCWRWPAIRGSGGTGVWGSRRDDVWIVHSDASILRWDGRHWLQVASGTTSALRGVHGTGGSDVWAVGDGGTILHWDGTAWSPVPSGTTSGLNGVWAGSATDAWAAGDGGLLLHWNGSGWSSSPSGTSARLRSVWGSGPSDVWAVGNGGTALHWDGGAWTAVPSGLTADLVEVWGGGPSDVWASPSVGTMFGAIHWDGLTWQAPVWDGQSWHPVFPSQAVGPRAWGSAPDDVWSVTDLAIRHWDGTRWSDVGGTSEYAWFAGVWGSGTDDVWLSGINGYSGNNYRGQLLRWDGKRLGEVPPPAGQAEFGGLGKAWVSGPSDVWLMGGFNGVVASHWDGQSWSPLPMANPLYPGASWLVNGFWGTGPTDVWAAGVNQIPTAPGQPSLGGVPHFNGTAWTLVPIPSASVDVIWGTGRSDAWAAGGVGLYHWDGRSWTESPVYDASGRVAYSPTALCGSSASDVWAPTISGVVAHFDGGGWTISSTSTRQNLVGCWAAGPGDAWAAGATGAVLHWDGVAWSTVLADLGPYGSLRGIWGSGPDDLWAVGSGIIGRRPGCGRLSQACCPGGGCHDALACQAGTCGFPVASCGEPGLPCCAASACMVPQTCQSGTCR